MITNNKRLYFYIASNLAFLIPFPGRFAYSIIMVILFNIQMALVTLFFHAIHRLDIASMRNGLLTLAIISLSILYKQILAIICPIAALTLGFCFFLPTLTSVIIEFFFLDYEHGLKSHLCVNMRNSLLMSVFALLFFLIRDVFGYGTITLPAWKKIVVIPLGYNPQMTGASVFLATIPGSLGLIAIFLAAYIFITKKIKIISNLSFDLFSKKEQETVSETEQKSKKNKGAK